jgi:selenocysteine lyase/cysteine desulfurase
MSLNRRELLTGIGGFAATAAFSKLGAQVSEASELIGAAERASSSSLVFPRKDDFIIEEGYTYINAAYTHPIPKVSLEAVRRAAEGRATLRAPAAGGGGRGRGGAGAAAGGGAPPLDAKGLFAELINAKPAEIASVSSTSAGENLVIQALELDSRFHGNVVSDALHFDGALVHLMELKKKGLDVRIVKPTKEFRIDMKDLEKVVDKNTRLIEVSSAAMYNGFTHDLKAVSDLAHANGAYVYADIIHSAGTGPFDIRASGVDFAACSSFKWLMGDFGTGFLYVREELLDKFARPVVGYQQASRMAGNFPPFGDESAAAVEYSLNKSAAGFFETGTFGNTQLLRASLNYIKELGVANIEAHRQPLLKRMRAEIPRFGFICVTPPEATGGNITFAKQGVGQSDLPRKLTAAKVNVRFSTHWMRLSPSVYNDMGDVERLLEALA